MKKVVSLFIAITMIVSAICFPTAVNAAVEYVTVYLNEKAIDFPTTDARPQIFSDRTYVPVRKTCEALGLSIDWNSKTETLTFNRDGITIAHTMRSSIVYVNGEAVKFDTPSINKNNRTLMPIRMLAESIGATVTWDDATRSVHITTPETVNTANGASVSSIAVDKTAVNNGDLVTFTAIANSSTDTVKFINASNNDELGISDSYVENSDGTRTFLLDYICKNNSGSQVILNIQAVPGAGSVYSEEASAYKTTGIIVSAEESSDSDYESEYMISCKLSSEKVATGSYAKVKVKTTDDVKKVKVTNNFNSRSVVVDDYDEDSSDNRTFEAKVEMTDEGTYKLYVYLYTTKEKDYESVYETLKVSVDDDYDEDDEEYDELEIIDMWLNNDYGYKGYDTTLYVKTSTDVDYLELLKEGQDEGEGLTCSSTAEKYSGYYYWEFDFEVKHIDIMKYTLVAYNEDGDSVSDTFRLEGRSFSKNEPLVVSINQKSSSVIEGEDIDFNIVTSSCTTKLRITRGTTSEVYSEESKASSGDTKTWKTTFECEDIDADYYATAYDENGNYDRMKFRITGDAYEEIEIIDYKIEDDEIEEGEFVNLTVTTSNSCEKLWVEQRDGRVSAVYKKYTREKNGKLVWEITFSPIDDGRQVFTIVAQDENEEEDYQDFRVTVK